MDPLTRYLWKRAGTQSGRTLVLLMYHGTLPNGSRSRTRYDVAASQFVQHLDLLQEGGWHTATVVDLLHADKLPEKTAVITFDDGYANNYEGAFLPLVERGMVATWYLVTSCLGGYATWAGGEPRQRMLTRDQAREVLAAGMEIGSHTCSHPDLTTLSRTRVRQEFADSRKFLEDLLGKQVSTVAYPYGQYDERITALAMEAGYGLACTTRSGWHQLGNDPFQLRRLTVFGQDSVSHLARKMAFGDNKMSLVQVVGYLMKRAAKRLCGT
jgi:peptidoglycan/xylan/chitin deacetylase (PgdA/CDA1 family)